MLLDSLKPTPTVRIPLDHPFERGADGAPIPLDGVAFVLAGPYTAAAREHFLAQMDATLAAPDAKPSLSLALADQRRTVLALLRGVEGLEDGGVPLTPETLAALADSPDHPALPRLLEQAYTKYAAVGDFFGGPKATSSPSLVMIDGSGSA